MAAPTDHYANDLAGLTGEIQQVRAMEEVCSERFPATAEANRQAVFNWRQQYSSFVSDIELRWERWLLLKSNGDPRQHTAMVAWSQQLYESTRNEFRLRLMSDGLALFQQRCERYPLYLTSPRMNPESAHAAVVSRIRRVAQ